MTLGNENWRERNALFTGEMILAKSLRVSTGGTVETCQRIGRSALESCQLSVVSVSNAKPTDERLLTNQAWPASLPQYAALGIPPLLLPEKRRLIAAAKA
jgi:hypothetical protein